MPVLASNGSRRSARFVADVPVVGVALVEAEVSGHGRILCSGTGATSADERQRRAGVAAPRSAAPAAARRPSRGDSPVRAASARGFSRRWWRGAPRTGSGPASIGLLGSWASRGGFSEAPSVVGRPSRSRPSRDLSPVGDRHRVDSRLPFPDQACAPSASSVDGLGFTGRNARTLRLRPRVSQPWMWKVSNRSGQRARASATRWIMFIGCGRSGRPRRVADSRTGLRRPSTGFRGPRGPCRRGRSRQSAAHGDLGSSVCLRSRGLADSSPTAIRALASTRAIVANCRCWSSSTISSETMPSPHPIMMQSLLDPALAPGFFAAPLPGRAECHRATLLLLEQIGDRD